MRPLIAQGIRLFLVLALAAGPAGATIPTVSSVNGTLVNGNTIAIGGAGFELKATAKPYLWCPVDDTSGNPSNLGVVTLWSGADHMTTTTTLTYSGTYAAASTAGWGSSIASLQRSVPTNYGGKVRIHFKRYSTQTIYYDPTNEIRNTKFLRIWTTIAGSATQNIYLGTQRDGSSILTAEQISPQQTGVTRFFIAGSFTAPPAAWRDEEYIFRINSSLGAADGHGEVRNDNSSPGSVDVWKMDMASKPGPVNLVFIQQDPSNFTADGNVYLDDLLIDQYWAKVFLCNASTYAASTVCEEQIPATWTDTGITATVNLGRLPGPHYYMYVTNDSGVGMSSGFDVVPPLPNPKNLQWNGNFSFSGNGVWR